MAKIVFIDAGHGGRDPGAVSGTFIEKELNLKVALAARDFLSAYDCQVYLYRTSDASTKINDMCAKAKALGAAVSISIHHNAGGGVGGEAFYWKGDAAARRLAGLVAKEFKAVSQVLRSTSGEEPGVKPSYADPPGHNFGMCRINSRNGIPAILGEFAFVDNAKDQKKIDTDDKLKAEGEAYGKAVTTFLNLQKKTVPITPKPPAATPPAAGKKLTLKNVSLYRSSTATAKSNSVTGTYWLYDGILISGRYRITNKESRVKKVPAALFVTGWIDKKDVTE